jgi:hypothetical protein
MRVSGTANSITFQRSLGRRVNTATLRNRRASQQQAIANPRIKRANYSATL